MTDDDPLSEGQKLQLIADMWKKSVDVQQHFNDIEWRIRGLALTAATATLAAAGLAANSRTEIANEVSVGSIIIVIGLMLWYAFYFVDYYWYHPLLRAAVQSGEAYEKKLVAELGVPGMTSTITEASGVTPGRLVGKAVSVIKLREPGSVDVVMRSTHKLRWFYLTGGLTLLVAAVALQIFALYSPIAAPTAPGSSTPTTSATP